ncbi:MAG: LuxR C-terminal-related transcriptional regulator [Stellaceae bacterium]
MDSAEQNLKVMAISEHTLTRLGMETFFAGSRYNIEHQVSSIAKALELASEPCDLVFIGSQLDDESIEPLKSLRQAYPQSRIVFCTQRVLLPPAMIIDVFSTKLDGCLLSDASAEILRQSLDLIMMGERVFPVPLLLAALPGEGAPGAQAHSQLHQFFSDRERQVLNFLREGQSNKFIARQLELSEATIKVHIKTLLRKIGCTNRTQAAIWVTKRGLMWDSQQHSGGDVAPESRATIVPLTPRDS